MKKLLVYLKEYRLQCFLGPLFKLLEAMFDLIVPIVMAGLIDNGISGHDNDIIVSRALILVGLAIVGLTCSITAQYFAAKAAIGFTKNVRSALFKHIQKLSYSQIEELSSSTLITRMTSDMTQLQSGVNMALRLFLRSPFIVFGAVIMAFTIDVKEALIFTVMIPLLAIVVFYVMLKTMPLYKKVQERLDTITGRTDENLKGVYVIRAFRREKDFVEDFEEDNSKLKNVQVHVGRVAALMNPLTYLILNAALLAVVYVGGIEINVGALKTGQIIALINYMTQILVELIKLADTIILTTKAVSCGNRVQSIFDVEPEFGVSGVSEDKDRAAVLEAIKEGISKEGSYESSDATAGNKTDNKTDNKAVSQNDIKTGNKKSNKGKGSGKVKGKKDKSSNGGKVGNDSGSGEYILEFDDVTFAYKNAGAPSIENISFKVRPGETVGIIGVTGSGKSTVVNLVPRFFDVTEGKILFKGKDIREYNLKELRKNISPVFQKANLISGTVRDNMKLAAPDATDADIEKALKVSDSYDFIKAKKGFLDFKIAEGAGNLSGGQKQRLCIARGVVKKPELLILDDSFSALDFKTERRVRQEIFDMGLNTSVIIVSQRVSSINGCEKIIVLDDGKIMGIGNHETLLKECEVYREICESQNVLEAS
ncbi:MAG: ABC transporter ATP-binding protein/permease [Lachnospiraceae bacterium]|nr:ABC transporter ATP-binding protein/permease [Lachnospiraceae bacterium]